MKTDKVRYSVRFVGVVLAVICLLASFRTASAQLSFGTAGKFNSDWLFALCTDSIAPADPSYDDSSWRQLDLPHDWSTESLPSPTLNSCTGFFPGGMGWYRKHFTVSDSRPVHYLYFEGVYNRSEVYVNGHLAGKRPNGYISFYYDITPYLVDGENVVAVKVDHTREADSRWYSGSGIYRDVYLVGAGRTHLAPWGMCWKASEISGTKATIVVDYSVVVPEGSASSVEVEASLRDAGGNIVATSRRTLRDNAGSLKLKVKNPHLWSTESPYLYELTLSLSENGSKADSAVCRVGLRSLEFDPDNGMKINGKSIKVKGVCLHHDAGVLGAVVPEPVWRRRLVNLKALGVNAIRMSHNPQAPVVYDLCDELGFLVMDEASDEWEYPKRKWVTGWNVGTPKYEGSYDFFKEWIERDVADMVRRDRNHPCVAFWSIGNEVDYPNDPYSHPVLDRESIRQHNYGGYDPSAPSAMRIGEIAMTLAPIVRALDGSRPVTGALAGVVMSNYTSYPDAVDIVGYNYTENRYAEDHSAYPDRVIYGSENDHSYGAWLAVRDNDFIFGQFLWTGIDYLGESREWPSRGLGTGLLDFGGFVKPRGKFRASLWRDDPVAYIGTYLPASSGDSLSIDAPALWNYDEGSVVRVVCYTNAASARLLLDGAEVGAVAPRDDSTGIIAWDIPFRPGNLSVQAMDVSGNVVATDSVVTSGLPYALRARIDESVPDSGGDLVHVLVEVVDDKGNIVPLADNKVTCTVEGGASLLGLEGTGNTDMTHPHSDCRRVSGGRLLAYVRRGTDGGTSRVLFTSPMLRSAGLSL